MQKFSGKNVVITGGSSGIGLATANLFVREGAKVIITGRNKKALDDAISSTQIVGVKSDQSVLTEIDELVALVKKENIKVDVLFINAGITAFAAIVAISEQHYDDIMNTNVKGALFTLNKFIPHLSEGGSVIFLSSINAYNAMATTAVYSASKAALNAIAKIAAIELAPKGIRVNTVCPGPVNTPLWTKIGMGEEQLAQVASLIQGKVPLKKFGTPDEIAKAVSFLASGESSFTTGSEFVVDGGFNLNTLVG